MTMIEIRNIVDREQWLGWRREHVTASTVGALFSVHPYTTALRLYAEKRGVDFPDMDNKIMRRGRWLEPAVAMAVEEQRPDWKLRKPSQYFFDPELRLGATPDFIVDAQTLGVLQAKTVAPGVFASQWQDGAEVPLWIILQATVEAMLTGADFMAIAALTVDPYAMDVHVIELPRNPAAEHKIRVAVHQFWQSVNAGIEPEPDYGRDADVLKALHPIEQPGKVLDLSGHNELPEILERRQLLMDEIKSKQDAIDNVTTQLMHLMGDAEVGSLDGWMIKYKSTDRVGYKVPAKRIRSLRVFRRGQPTERT